MNSSPSPGLPPFDTPVPTGGYRWWYVDGRSDCGRFGIVVILFIGSVFSPYYYRARRQGTANPYDHCAINVALYGPRRKRWAMTERRESALHIEPHQFAVGASRASWDGSALRIDVDERSAPFAQRLRGEIVLEGDTTSNRVFTLDSAGRHVWQPILPCAKITVGFDSPALGWRGDGYLDGNAGETPLEQDLRSWDWSRVATKDGVMISYDVRDRQGTGKSIAALFDSAGSVTDVSPPQPSRLRRTAWGISREARCAGTVRLQETLEDTPFYARSALTVDNDDGSFDAIHESLSLDRFRRAWVRTLLPFRMPRVFWK